MVDESDPLRRGRKKKVFLYRQLAELIREHIVGGGYKAGDRIPSMDDLSAQYQVNKATVRSALTLLGEEGLIYSSPAQGTFVSGVEDSVTPAILDSDTMITGLLSTTIYPGHTGPYHLKLIEGIRKELGELKANLVHLPIQDYADSDLGKVIQNARLNSLILLGPMDLALIKRIAATKIAAVLLDQVAEEINMDCISIDNKGGGRAAMQHLLDFGHRQIAVIAGDPKHPATIDRMNGAFAQLKRSPHAKEPYVEYGRFIIEGGYEATQKLLKLKPRPTAIFCMNDEMAAGAIQAIHEHSALRIPQDISVMGFDDSPLATMLHPRLTSVKAPTDAMARSAVQRLKEQMELPEHFSGNLTLATVVVGRDSTGQCP